jgi:hypothetical protein
MALLSIGASYLALSDYVTVVPRLWLPGLMTVSVVALLIAHARGRYRLARTISFVLLGLPCQEGIPPPSRYWSTRP